VGVGAQGRREAIWVFAVRNDKHEMNMGESLGSSLDKISKTPFLNAPKQDQVIGRLPSFVKTGKWLRD